MDPQALRVRLLGGVGEQPLPALGSARAESPLDLAASDAPLSQMVILRIGQGVAAVLDEATAFSQRDAGSLCRPITAWTEQADDGRVIERDLAFAAAVRPFSSGFSYLNSTAKPDHVRDAYGDPKVRAPRRPSTTPTSRPACSASIRTCDPGRRRGAPARLGTSSRDHRTTTTSPSHKPPKETPCTYASSASPMSPPSESSI
jgi:hypothetical protein